MNALTVTRRLAAAGPVLHVTGDLDYEEADALREQVEGLVLRPGQRLCIELSGLTFCDSTGITVLLAARQTALAAGAVMTLAGVPADTLRILTVAGLDRVFDIVSSSTVV